MAALNDHDLATVVTPEDAARLTAQLLPDVGSRHPEFFFRPAEQHLLAYMLVNAALKGQREASHLEAFLALDYLPMIDRLKADKASELQEHAAYLKALSDPRLSHARWGVGRVFSQGG